MRALRRIDWRRVMHNVVAHPLLVLWPQVGEALHDRTVPVERCEGCRSLAVTHWDVEGVPLCDDCWNDLVREGPMDRLPF